MEITVLEADDDLANASYFAEWSEYFITPSIITKENIADIGRVDNIHLSYLYSFKSDSHRYLMFEDELNLDSESVLDSLNSIRAIKDPKGRLCEAKDKTDATYGVSPDHDPFHDGYMYLWYCGQEKAI